MTPTLRSLPDPDLARLTRERVSFFFSLSEWDKAKHRAYPPMMECADEWRFRGRPATYLDIVREIGGQRSRERVEARGK